jgi:serine protease
MKRSTRRSVAIALSVALLCNTMPVLAASPKANYVAPNTAALVSDRLIVKYKANNLPRGLSVAQIKAQLMQPLTAQAVSQLQAAAGVTLTELHAISNGAHVLSVAGQPNRQILNNAIAGIRRLGGIEYVEEDAIMTAQAAPNDTYYTTGPTGNPGLWGLMPAATVASPAPGFTGSYGADFQTAWSTVTGSSVVVAVVDTGITPHVDIVGTGGTVAAGAGSNLVSTGYDFTTDCRIRGTCASTTATASAYIAPSANATDLGDFITLAECQDPTSLFYDSACTAASNSSWHGTHVAGTIAALGNNFVGVIGGAYNAKVLPVRVLGKGGGYTSDVANGIMWAAGVASITATYPNPNPAKVINLSLGGSGACGATYQNAIDAAVAAGTVVVVAAGNSNADVANFQPASCANVITVAAIARDGSRAYYSNYSSPASNTTNPTNVTLAAQGGDQSYPATFDPGILSSLNSVTTTPATSGGSNYVYYQGTSMATPHAAAAAALMLAKNSALTPAQIKTILSAPSSLTTFPSFSAGWASWDCATTQHCGAGVLNANLAVQNSAPTVNAPATSNFGSVFINGTVNRTVTLTNTWFFSAQAGTATVTGTNASRFSIGTDTCSGTAIAANGTCQITVSYVPTVSGAHTATLTVPIVSASSPVLVNLTGASVVQLTTADMTAATVAAGQSTTVNLSYTNPNVTAVNVGAISLSSAIMATSVDNCSNSTLAAGASCTATVTITPAAAGVYSGTASLTLSVGGTPAVATISGTANAPVASSGGGGGCSIMPFGADPDLSLLLAMLAVAGYWFRRRIVRGSSAG